MIYDFKATNYKGEEVYLADFKGKNLLIVNTASKCGFTPQYKELQALYQKHGDELEILAFPCNQFGGQEPEGEEKIKEFCDLQFNITFPLMKKIEVNGKNTPPLFQFLKKELPGVMGSEMIKWNFTKFLFSKDGTPLKRFAPKDTPEKIKEFMLSEKLMSSE